MASVRRSSEWSSDSPFCAGTRSRSNVVGVDATEHRLEVVGRRRVVGVALRVVTRHRERQSGPGAARARRAHDIDRPDVGKVGNRLHVRHCRPARFAHRDYVVRAAGTIVAVAIPERDQKVAVLRDEAPGGDVAVFASRRGDDGARALREQLAKPHEFLGREVFLVLFSRHRQAREHRNVAGDRFLRGQRIGPRGQTGDHQQRRMRAGAREPFQDSAERRAQRRLVGGGDVAVSGDADHERKTIALNLSHDVRYLRPAKPASLTAYRDRAPRHRREPRPQA